MTVKTGLTRSAFAVVALGALLGAAGPALANHDSSKNGAVHAWTSTDNKTLNVADTTGDSNDVYSNMTRSGVSGTPNLRNSNGVGSTATKTYSQEILGIQACIDDAGSDTCDSWR